jgi:hypothetical protein
MPSPADLSLIIVLLMGVALIALIVRSVRRMKAELGPSRPDDDDERITVRVCRRCGYDMRDIGDRCPECGHLHWNRSRYIEALANDWPDSPIDPVSPLSPHEIVQLLSVMDGWEADLIVKQLHARGVWADLEADSKTEMMGAVAQRVPFYRVLVTETDKDRAAEIIDRLREEGGPLLDASTDAPEPLRAGRAGGQ